MPALDPRPDWFDAAACLGTDPSLFYPEVGESAGPAKAVCATCPVTAECGEHGWSEKHGVWGGLAEKDRRGNRTLQRRAS